MSKLIDLLNNGKTPKNKSDCTSTDKIKYFLNASTIKTKKNKNKNKKYSSSSSSSTSS